MCDFFCTSVYNPHFLRCQLILFYFIFSEYLIWMIMPSNAPHPPTQGHFTDNSIRFSSIMHICNLLVGTHFFQYINSSFVIGHFKELLLIRLIWNGGTTKRRNKVRIKQPRHENRSGTGNCGFLTPLRQHKETCSWLQNTGNVLSF